MEKTGAMKKVDITFMMKQRTLRVDAANALDLASFLRTCLELPAVGPPVLIRDGKILKGDDGIQDGDIVTVCSVNVTLVLVGHVEPVVHSVIRAIVDEKPCQTWIVDEARGSVGLLIPVDIVSGPDVEARITSLARKMFISCLRVCVISHSDGEFFFVTNSDVPQVPVWEVFSGILEGSKRSRLQPIQSYLSCFPNSDLTLRALEQGDLGLARTIQETFQREAPPLLTAKRVFSLLLRELDEQKFSCPIVDLGSLRNLCLVAWKWPSDEHFGEVFIHAARVISFPISCPSFFMGARLLVPKSRISGPLFAVVKAMWLKSTFLRLIHILTAEPTR